MAKALLLCKKKAGCCPSIYPPDEQGNIRIGGESEGFTLFTKDQFELLVDQAKLGNLDEYLKKFLGGLKNLLTALYAWVSG